MMQRISYQLRVASLITSREQNFALVKITSPDHMFPEKLIHSVEKKMIFFSLLIDLYAGKYDKNQATVQQKWRKQ